MSLVRLLAIGQSLDGAREATARYRVPRQSLLPRFGSGTSATSCPPMGRPEPSRAMSASSSSGFWAIPSKWRAGWEQTKSPREQLGVGVLKCLIGARAVTEYALRALGRLAGRLSAVRRFAERRPATGVRLQQSTTTPIQGELSLDAVKVIRNDLSDADLEVVPAGMRDAPAGKSSPAEPAAWHRLANVSWGRFAVRLFQVPAGFQDESGFHLGVKPAEKEVHWPPLW